MTRRRAGREDGMGLMFVLGLGLLVMGMGALAHMLVTHSLDTGARHVRQEQAFHLAEQGIDQTVARLNGDASFNTDADFGAMPAGVTTLAQEEEWVRTTVAAAPPATVQGAPGGELVVIKPSNRGVVYAAAWVPSRARAKSLRVLRNAYVQDNRMALSHAILTQGALRVTGNPTVSGLGASVHTNADGDLAGSPAIAGSLTAAGTFARTGGNVAGTMASGVPAVPIPQIDPRTIWTRHAAATADWYDLCADGTVRQPMGGAPCAGAVLATATAASFRGWRLSGTTWQFAGSADFGGVYYAYGAGMSIAGNAGSGGTPWRVTLITEPLASGGGDCPERQTGDIVLAGTVSPTAQLDGLLAVSGRDLLMAGTLRQVFSGIVTAQEQVEITGNATLRGVVVAQGDCDSAASPVHLNRIDGNMTVHYDGDLGVEVDGGVRTTLWSEL